MHPLIHSLARRHEFLSAPPKEVVDSWPTPNYINPETRPPVVPIIVAIFMTLNVAVAVIQFYTAKFIMGKIRFNEILLLMALICMIPLSVLMTLLCQVYQQNRHVWDEHLGKAGPTFLKINFVVPILTVLANFFIKAAVLNLVRRLIRGTHMNVVRFFLRISAIALVCCTIAFIVGEIHVCSPLSNWWKLTEWDVSYGKRPSGCNMHLETILAIIASIYFTFETFVCAILPTIVVCKLYFRNPHMKTQLLCLFSLAYGALVLDIVRSGYAYYTTARTYDFTWYLWVQGLVCLLETYIGYLAACAPILKTFYVYQRTLYKNRKANVPIEKQEAELERVVEEEKDDFWDRPMSLTEDERRWIGTMIFKD